MRAFLVATALATVDVAALGAQGPATFERIPIIPGGRRDEKTEAQLMAAPVTGGGARQVSVYRIPASIERMFKFYTSRLAAKPADAADTALPAGIGATPVTYRVLYHSFDDECVDSAARAPDSTSAPPACGRWRRGKDKRRALDLSRIASETGRWVESATFTWHRREPNGAVRHFRVELTDVGLSADWKRCIIMGQLLVESIEEPPGDP